MLNDLDQGYMQKPDFRSFGGFINYGVSKKLSF